MSHLMHVPGGIITMCDTDFICPICTCPNDAMRWLDNPKSPMVGRIKCKGCKRFVGITTDMKGDVVVWEIAKK